MRCRITNPKKLKKIGNLLGREVAMASTRGGTNHRIDVGCSDGTAWHVWQKDRIEKMNAKYEKGIGLVYL
jgi:hypothetical protein